MAGMKLRVGTCGVPIVDVRVNLRGRNVGMPQHLLNRTDLRAVSQQMTCETVS